MMKKVLLVMVLAVAVFAVGCKRADVNQADKSGDYASGSYADNPSSRGDYEVNVALKVVNFDFDKYNLTDTAVAILKTYAAFLLANPGVNILVEGHTDEIGTIEYNLALGQRRADAVKRFYVQLGVASNRIATISFGKEKPVNPNSNEEAWAQNRRAETKTAIKK